MVWLEVRYEGKVPMAVDNGSWRAIRGTRWDELYVCPRTKLLRRYQAPHRAKAAHNPRRPTSQLPALPGPMPPGP